MSGPGVGNDSLSDTPTGAALRPDEYDALAELFLGAGAPASDSPRLRFHGADAPPETESSPPIEVEGLVLGHLPVLSGPWVAQYARWLCDTGQAPVALLRVYGDQASLDLFAPDDSEQFKPSEELHDAAAVAATRATLWVLRVDPTSEPALASAAGVDRVTLLCGADDAAIVSAYQTIKRLHTERTGGAPEVFDEDGPQFRVVIIGASADKARAASQKIRRAATAFLSLDIDVATGPAQVGPTRGITLYRGQAPVDFEAFAAGVHTGEFTPTDPVAMAIEEEPMQSGLPHEAVGAPRADTSPGPVDPVPVTGSGVSTTRHPSDSLLEHLSGLKAIDVRCPYAEEIELACDSAGKVHLLGRLTDDTCRAFEIVSAWASDHRHLLAHLIGIDSLDAQSPQRHVFVESAPEARRLLDSDMQIHLLLETAVDGRTIVVCTPLNAPTGAWR